MTLSTNSAVPNPISGVAHSGGLWTLDNIPYFNVEHCIFYPAHVAAFERSELGLAGAAEFLLSALH